jgi:hypothetical protein
MGGGADTFVLECGMVAVVGQGCIIHFVCQWVCCLCSRVWIGIQAAGCCDCYGMYLERQHCRYFGCCAVFRVWEGQAHVPSAGLCTAVSTSPPPAAGGVGPTCPVDMHACYQHAVVVSCTATCGCTGSLGQFAPCTCICCCDHSSVASCVSYHTTLQVTFLYPRRL